MWVCACSANGLRGKLGKEAYLEKWLSTLTSFSAAETAFTITFDWDEHTGVPGAFVVRNHHHSQFYLKTVTLEHVPGHGRVHFVCNSWVYPAHRYKYNRVFFSNKVTTSQFLDYKSKKAYMCSLNLELFVVYELCVA